MADKSKRTPSKKSKGEETPTFTSDLNKYCVEKNFTAELIFHVLNAEISAGFPWTTFKPDHKASPDVVERFDVYIAYEHFEKQGVIDKVYIKHEKIPMIFLEALYEVFLKYETITSIKFEYCSLMAKEIEFLQTILNEFQNIVDLSLDGNPNCSQNFAVVLNDTNIKYLSLKRCKINECGIQNICEILWHNKLLTLNLTGNFIDDNSVTHIVKMLRQNRKLRILNLADNWITDTGCYEIMSSLQKFVLTHDEIVIKRRKNLDFYIQKTELIATYKREHAVKQKNQPVSAPGSKKNTARKEVKPPKINTAKEDKLLNNYVESNLTRRTHPFTIDTVETDGELHCSGNLRLSYINLAYNKISTTGYREIIKTLNYQLDNDYLGTGLVYITLDGNTDLNSTEFFDIYKILLDKKLKMALNSASKTVLSNRRTSSIYNSILNVVQ